MASVKMRLTHLDQCVRRWRSEGRRYPELRSAQEVCAALDRIGVQWAWTDGSTEHQLKLSRPGKGERPLAFCPSIYLPEHDAYLDVTDSGMDWPARRVKTTSTSMVRGKIYKAQRARVDLGIDVIVIYGRRYLKLTGRNRVAAVNCFHELLRQGRRDLHLVLAPSAGFVADLMIGAGALADVEFSSLSFMEYGFAPNFRRKAEAGTLRFKEHS